jgi:transcription elongation factor Elf1
MAIWTLSCPSCGHHFRSLVMEGTKVPQVWVCSACGSREAAPVDVQEGGPFTAGGSSCGCGCG